MIGVVWTGLCDDMYDYFNVFSNEMRSSNFELTKRFSLSVLAFSVGLD
jgi:hypothetical protein